MNSVKNSVSLIGYLGRDPEVRKFENGRTMARFSLATNEYYRNGNGDRVESTEWHNCVAWGKTAEVAQQYLAKGKEVAVRGKLRHRSWEDKDGNKRYTTEVEVQEFLMLGNKS